MEVIVEVETLEYNVVMFYCLPSAESVVCWMVSVMDRSLQQSQGASRISIGKEART